jgi:hypothetical protein
MRNLLLKTKNYFLKLRTVFNRGTFAYLMMLSFILFTTVGAALVYPPAGFITAGIACGLFGYLLGRE